MFLVGFQLHQNITLIINFIGMINMLGLIIQIIIISTYHVYFITTLLTFHIQYLIKNFLLLALLSFQILYHKQFKNSFNYSFFSCYKLVYWLSILWNVTGWGWNTIKYYGMHEGIKNKSAPCKFCEHLIIFHKLLSIFCQRWSSVFIFLWLLVLQRKEDLIWSCFIMSHLTMSLLMSN